MLLIIIAIKFIEMIFLITGFKVIILSMDFESIFSIVLTLVVGIEFIKMLYKHTPETVVDVLLFAISRQIILTHGKIVDMLIGVITIIGLFCIKKYLIDSKKLDS